MLPAGQGFLARGHGLREHIEFSVDEEYPRRCELHTTVSPRREHTAGGSRDSVSEDGRGEAVLWIQTPCRPARAALLEAGKPMERRPSSSRGRTGAGRPDLSASSCDNKVRCRPKPATQIPSQKRAAIRNSRASTAGPRTMVLCTGRWESTLFPLSAGLNWITKWGECTLTSASLAAEIHSRCSADRHVKGELTEL